MEMDWVNGILKLSSFFCCDDRYSCPFCRSSLNKMFAPLREFSIPEPVTGGILFSVLIATVYVVTDIEIEFDLMARDVLLVYFFLPLSVSMPALRIC